MRVIDTIKGEGFTCVIREDNAKRVIFTADADCDADGANGQNGKKPAYMVGDVGSEFLKNGGMKMKNGRVIGKESWFRDIVIVGADGEPKEFPGGIIASKTAYRYPGKSLNDPSAYVDAETVPYVCVPPIIVRAVVGIVKGCMTRVTNMRNGRVSQGVVADVGPRRRVGECSIQMLRELRIPESPRTGGEDEPIIRYELWPGVPAVVNGHTFVLQPS